jgi:hypothetical protein
MMILRLSHLWSLNPWRDKRIRHNCFEAQAPHRKARAIWKSHRWLQKQFPQVEGWKRRKELTPAVANSFIQDRILTAAPLGSVTP